MGTLATLGGAFFAFAGVVGFGAGAATAREGRQAKTTIFSGDRREEKEKERKKRGLPTGGKRRRKGKDKERKKKSAFRPTPLRSTRHQPRRRSIAANLTDELPLRSPLLFHVLSTVISPAIYAYDFLQALGPCPNSSVVDEAKSKITALESITNNRARRGLLRGLLHLGFNWV